MQGLQSIRRDHLKRDRLRIQLLHEGYIGRFFIAPLGGATESSRVFDRYLLVRQQGIDRIQRIVSLGELNAVAVIDGPFIAQRTLLVEDKDVWRGLRAVGLGDTLGLLY